MGPEVINYWWGLNIWHDDSWFFHPFRVTKFVLLSSSNENWQNILEHTDIDGNEKNEKRLSFSELRFLSMASGIAATNEYARRSANRRVTRFCEDASSLRSSSSSNRQRMTPLNMLLAEEAECDTVRRRSTLVNMPVVAETSNLYHSSDGNPNDANEVLTDEQIQAFQEAFALFDKVLT